MSRSAVVLRRVFVAASAVWAAAIPAAAVASSLTAPVSAVYVLTSSVFAVGAVVCHQLPERSIHLWGRQFPVCARCTGVYVATALVGIGLMLSGRSGAGATSPRSWRIGMGVVALAANGLTLLYEWTTGIAPTNAVRGAAGAALGAVVAALVVYDVD